jgi:hypothetical protein
MSSVGDILFGHDFRQGNCVARPVRTGWRPARKNYGPLSADATEFFNLFRRAFLVMLRDKSEWNSSNQFMAGNPDARQLEGFI